MDYWIAKAERALALAKQSAQLRAGREVAEAAELAAKEATEAAEVAEWAKRKFPVMGPGFQI